MKKSKLSQADSTTDFKLLNQEEIDARRIPVENAELSLSSVKNWHCHYCCHRFKNELTFMKHYCEPKRRAQELMTPTGQAAFGFYKEWMRMKKYSQPGAAAFMESKFYRAFINFAQLIQDANISKPDRYMSLMVEASILPILWCRNQCYSVYLDYMDRVSDPIDQVQDSINYLLDICEREEYSLFNVFEKLGPQQVLSLVRQRRLTPWLLFCSPTFGAMLKTLDKHQLSAFNTVVNANYWQERFSKEKQTLEQIRSIVKELGL